MWLRVEISRVLVRSVGVGAGLAGLHSCETDGCLSLLTSLAMRATISNAQGFCCFRVASAARALPLKRSNCA